MPDTDDNNFASTPLPENTISRRPVLEYFPEVRGRMSRFFSSREKMTDGLKTFAWVVPLTLLIWIYAEREQVVQPNSPNLFNVYIKIHSTNDRLNVEPVGSQDQTVNLQLTGPQQAFEHVREELTMRIPHGLTINVDNMPVGHNQAINIVNQIQNMDIFKSSGVTVQASQPPEIFVNVEKMGRREVPVQIPPTITNLTAESRFDPPTVLVTGPEPLLSDFDKGNLKVLAKLDDYAQLKQPGHHELQGVALVLSSPVKLTITPGNVKLNAVVVASDVSYTITKGIPIRISAEDTTLSRFDVVLISGDSIANIHVKGTPQAIEAIEKETFPVRAELEVEPTDQGKDVVTRTLTYKLPEGATVMPEDLARTVEFKLTHRE